MRKSLFKNSVLMLLALVVTVTGLAQQPVEEDPQLFPIVYGSKADGLPQKITVRGTISQISCAPPQCGELIFAATLEKGSTYRAQVTRDQEQEWRLVAPLKLPLHHAARVEWLNLKEFPALNKPPSGTLLKQIIFKVVEKKTVKVTGQYRWNTTYECRIIAVE